MQLHNTAATLKIVRVSLYLILSLVVYRKKSMYISVRVSPLYACVGNGSHTVSLKYVMGREKGGRLEIHVLYAPLFFSLKLLRKRLVHRKFCCIPTVFQGSLTLSLKVFFLS